MSELEETVTETAEDTWVDDALSRSRGVSTADVAEMDLWAGFEDLLAHIWASDHAVGRTPGRGRRAVLTLAVVGGLLGTGGIAAAAAGTSYRSVGGALTGVFGQPGKTENDTSEIVDLNAADFPVVASRLAQQLQQDGLRFAPGYDMGHNVEATVHRLQRLGGETDVTGVEGWIADDAACSWQRSWLTAHDHDDQAAMGVASAGLRQTAGLTIMSQINNTESMSELASDAEQGNAAPLQANVTLNCPVSLP